MHVSFTDERGMAAAFVVLEGGGGGRRWRLSFRSARHGRCRRLDLSPDEREMLAHPRVGGVILFARNYAVDGPAPRADQRDSRRPVTGAADRGRSRGRARATVRRRLHAPTADALARPSLRSAIRHSRENLAVAMGVVLAAELAAHGIDFSFTPVLDIDFGTSSVIGDRAFHTSADAVAYLASRAVRGHASGRYGSRRQAFPGPWLRRRRLASRGAGRRAGSDDHRAERSRAVPDV